MRAWTRREFGTILTAGAAAALSARPSLPAAEPQLRMTRGPVDARMPRDVPAGDTWVYGLALPLQIAPRLAALFCNIKGALGNDFEAGNDLILFDAVEAGVRGTVALARNHEARNPRAGKTMLMVKYPSRGGFVPFGARRADGSAHPHAGTGFGIYQAVAWPLAGKTEARGPEHYQNFELQQYRYDGKTFRVVATESVETAELVPGWTIHDGAITNGILDGDDFLVGMAGGKFDPGGLEVNNGGDVASGAGVLRWRRRGDAWRPDSFTLVTETDLSFEPSLIRDQDGSLLFCARGGPRAIRVWRSTDRGASWTKLIHLEGAIAGSPISINQAADGTPYVVSNLYDVLLHPVASRYRPRKNAAGVTRGGPVGREKLCLWPLTTDRNALETPILARDAVAEFGPAPSGDTWNIDHPSGATVQLGDGRWHHVVAMRICDHGEVSAGVAPAAQSGTYIEEILSPGSAIPAWKF